MHAMQGDATVSMRQVVIADLRDMFIAYLEIWDKGRTGKPIQAITQALQMFVGDSFSHGLSPG
jgi:hypothetical protein